MLNVGLAFGGVSPEHEVSVISSLQAAAALDTSRFNVVPIYIAKDGRWYTGRTLLDLDRYADLGSVVRSASPVVIDMRKRGKLRISEPRRWGLRMVADIDVMLLGLHGGSGEDGGLQGLCEVVDVPYTGSGVLGSSVGMDKCISKMVCRENDIPVVDFVQVRESDWAGLEERVLDDLESFPGLPCVVKPARLGSSIGIGFASNRDELSQYVEEALRYDTKLVIERAVPDLVEVNCSVLGRPEEAFASVLEQPVTSGGTVLSYGDKYMRRGGAKGGSKASAAGMASLDRIIPAPLDEKRSNEIRDLAVRIFRLLECAGVARIDFMIDGNTRQVYFNEINTIPGSFSFYLWQPTGVDFPDLVSRMIDIAIDRHRASASHIRSYDVNLLSAASLSGLKRSKG